MSIFWEKAVGSLFTSLGTTASLEHMFERCLNARTKKEEEWLVEKCLEVIKSRMEEPINTSFMVKRGLAFVIFADLLGYKSDFAQIYAVKMAQFGTLCEKKIGYLSCIFLLQSSNPLAVMVVNTILRDLGSKNILVVAMAASASCYLIPRNLATTVLPLLAEKLNHPSDFLRGKVIIAFQHFLRFCPEHCCHYIDSVCFLLGDKDPSVVGYVLQFMLDVAKVNKSLLINLIPQLIDIQRQILAGKLSEIYSYRGLLCPWMQITLLRLLQFSESCAMEIAAVCQETWYVLKVGKRTLLREALKIECLNTLLQPENEQILNMAMEYVEELLPNSNSNLRYAGLDLLQTVIHLYKITLSSQQQKVMMEYLEHGDLTVKQKILNVLCVAANERNVDMVCSKIADNALLSYKDNAHFQIELINQAVKLADKYPNTNNYWHVAMLIRLLPLADKTLSKFIQQRIKTALSSDDDRSVSVARHKVLQILRKCSELKTASTSVLEIYIWFLSHFEKNHDECGNNSLGHCVEEILQLGRKILKNQAHDLYLSPEIERLLVAVNDGLTHVVDKYGIYPDILDYLRDVKSKAGSNSYLHKYCMEILRILPHSRKLHRCLKAVSWYKEMDVVDLTLSFLDWFVCENVQSSENLYHPKFTKLVATEGSILPFNAEYFLYSETDAIEHTSTICTSPVISKAESCFGSFGFEDMKFCSVESCDKEHIEIQITWTKTGRVQDKDAKANTNDVDGNVQVPIDNGLQSTHDSMHIFRNKEHNKKLGNHDPLKTLLIEDFQKLSVNTDKS